MYWENLKDLKDVPHFSSLDGPHKVLFKELYHARPLTITGEVNKIPDRVVKMEDGERILVTTNPNPRNWKDYDKVITYAGLESADPDDASKKERTIWSLYMEAISISAATDEEIEGYIYSPKTDVGLTYISSGSSLSNRIETHKLMRGWKHIPLFDLPPHVPNNEVDFIDSRHWGMHYHNKYLWNPVPIRAKLSNLVPKSNFEIIQKENLPRTFDNAPYIPSTRPLLEVDSIDRSHVVKHIRESGGQGNYYVANTKELEETKRNLLHKEYEQYKSEDGNLNDTVIMPSTFTHRTEGARSISNRKELETFKLEVMKKFFGQFVIQLYIDNPLLYNGKKCHFRPLVMIKNTDSSQSTSQTARVLDKMRIYSAAKEFSPNDLSKEVVDTHATSSPEVILYDPYGKDIPVNNPIIRRRALAICRDIASKFKNLQLYPEHEQAYHILAPDIIFDANYVPFLLEVNTRPAFSSGTRHEKMIAQWEFFNGIEPFFFPITFSKLSNVDRRERFLFLKTYSMCLENIEEHEVNIAYQRGEIVGYLITRPTGEIIVDAEHREIIIRLLYPSILTQVWSRYSRWNDVFRYLLWEDVPQKEMFYNAISLK